MSSPLENIERRVVSLHTRLSLRPSLEVAIEIGDLLCAAKSELKHGEFLPWLRTRCKISPRLGQVYQQVAANAKLHSHSRLPENITIDKFLRIIRTAKYRQPDPPPDNLCPPVPQAKVFRADCRTWKGWTEQAGCVYTDPPWLEPDLYSWLGVWAGQILRPGGILLCQCGTKDIPDRIARITAGGLSYHWVLGIIYDDAFRVRPAHGFASCFRPMLMFVKGKWEPGKVVLSDTYTVRQGGHLHHKRYHRWQQPLDAIQHFAKLTKPNSLTIDPFAGSGTTGVAIMNLGEGRRWIGTEINPDTHKICRNRLRDAAAQLVTPKPATSRETVV